MFTNLFGNYLISRGKLTEEKLNAVKMSGEKTRVKLGLIAVSEKMITEKQADEINRKQAVMDKRFGDIAVELGYLTGDQVGRLLDLQGNAYMVFAQVVTDLGYMTLAEVEEEFAAYAVSLKIDDKDIAAFKADDLDVIIPYFLPSVDSKISDLIAIAIRTVNRLISSDISIEKGELFDIFSSSNFSYQVLNGDFKVTTGFASKDESILIIADTFAGETFDFVDEDALDSVGEFINIINGLYATSLSYKKIKVDMMPPVLCTSEESIEASSVSIVPIIIKDKKVNLIVAIN